MLFSLVHTVCLCLEDGSKPPQGRNNAATTQLTEPFEYNYMKSLK